MLYAITGDRSIFMMPYLLKGEMITNKGTQEFLCPARGLMKVCLKEAVTGWLFFPEDVYQRRIIAGAACFQVRQHTSPGSPEIPFMVKAVLFT